MIGDDGHCPSSSSFFLCPDLFAFFGLIGGKPEESRGKYRMGPDDLSPTTTGNLA
jgi:hypothetical protein